MQAFDVDKNLETHLLSGKSISNVLDEKKVLLFTDDAARTISIYRGLHSDFILYLIAKRIAQQIRKHMRGFYRILEIDISDESLIKSLKKAKISADGKILEVVNTDLYEKGKIPEGKIELVQKYDWKENLTLKKITQFADISTQEIVDTIKHEKIYDDIPKSDEYKTEMLMVGTSIYTPTQQIEMEFKESILKKIITPHYEKLGNLQEGIFFQEGYSTRFTIKGGRIQAIEFMKKQKEKSESSQDVQDFTDVQVPVLFINRLLTERPIGALATNFNYPEEQDIDELIQSAKNFQED